MEKNLTVYPIASGDMLNVFANNEFSNIKILDMHGNVVCTAINIGGLQGSIDIRGLDSATYIVEVVYTDNKKARSVFVKV